ncbi:MAG: hypothetical protein RL434_2699 [Pseudomonadota bacterium]
MKARKTYFLNNFQAILLALTCGSAGAQNATDLTCSGCVGTADLANSSVTAPKIPNGAIGGLKLANGAVTTVKVTDGAITTSKIANGAITNLKLGAGAVNSAKILNGSVASEDLSPALAERLNGAVVLLTTLPILSAAPLYSSAQCPADRIPISANCSCESYGGVLNYGTLQSCFTTSAGAVASCLIDGLTYNPAKAFPEAAVAAICLGATRSDGLPWLPVSNASAQGDLISATGSVTGAPDHDAATAEMEVRMADYQQVVRESTKSK